jgi:hypothetical protein
LYTLVRSSSCQVNPWAWTSLRVVIFAFVVYMLEVVSIFINSKSIL